MLLDFSEFDAASTPQAADHITVRSRPTASAARAGYAMDLQQRIQAQKLQLQLAQLDRDTAKLQLKTA